MATTEIDLVQLRSDINADMEHLYQRVHDDISSATSSVEASLRSDMNQRFEEVNQVLRSIKEELVEIKGKLP